jgi:hypothetical protein
VGGPMGALGLLTHGWRRICRVVAKHPERTSGLAKLDLALQQLSLPPPSAVVRQHATAPGTQAALLESQGTDDGATEQVLGTEATPFFLTEPDAALV